MFSQKPERRHPDIPHHDLSGVLETAQEREAREEAESRRREDENRELVLKLQRRLRMLKICKCERTL